MSLNRAQLIDNIITNEVLENPAEQQTVLMVNFLRAQADDLERRSAYYRELATALERKDMIGLNKSVQQALPDSSSEIVKRGRPPKARLRNRNPDAKKRSHTAYTLFVQETFPNVKSSLQEDKSNKVMVEVAKQWANLNDSEKEKYKNMAATIKNTRT